MANTAINGNGMPKWAKITATLGFPIVVAFVLLGMLIGYLPSPITETLEAVTDIQKDLDAHEGFDETRIRILRGICRNTADNEFELANCDI